MPLPMRHGASETIIRTHSNGCHNIYFTNENRVQVWKRRLQIKCPAGQTRNEKHIDLFFRNDCKHECTIDRDSNDLYLGRAPKVPNYHKENILKYRFTVF